MTDPLRSSLPESVRQAIETFRVAVLVDSHAPFENVNWREAARRRLEKAEADLHIAIIALLAPAPSPPQPEPAPSAPQPIPAAWPGPNGECDFCSMPLEDRHRHEAPAEEPPLGLCDNNIYNEPHPEDDDCYNWRPLAAPPEEPRLCDVCGSEYLRIRLVTKDGRKLCPFHAAYPTIDANGRVSPRDAVLDDPKTGRGHWAPFDKSALKGGK